MKNFKNQASFIYFEDNIFEKLHPNSYLCQCIKRHCIKDLIFFEIVIFERVMDWDLQNFQNLIPSKISGYTVFLCIQLMCLMI